jgi:SAM-dependent methyltransferase
MNNPTSLPGQGFDENYFKTGPYADVSFKRYSQYWWSNRYYALLTRRFGPKSGRLLEIGCGLGHLLVWMVDRYNIYGTDINLSALCQARKNVPGGNYLQLSAEDLRVFPDGCFQIVIAKHVVEHLPDPEKAIVEISRVLAPGGLFLVATPNLDSPARSLKKEMWIGYKDPTHISLKFPGEWLDLMSSNRLRPRRIFSDGLWDAPYIPWIPVPIQKVLFGAPGGLQAILGWSIIPLRMGESLIVLADKV